MRINKNNEFFKRTNSQKLVLIAKMCSFDGCNRRNFIAGHCKVCESKFCKMHRMPEKHHCSKLNEYNKSLRIENISHLQTQRCIKSKVRV